MEMMEEVFVANQLYCHLLFFMFIQSRWCEFDGFGAGYWPAICDLCLWLFSVIKAYNLLILNHHTQLLRIGIHAVP